MTLNMKLRSNFFDIGAGVLTLIWYILKFILYILIPFKCSLQSKIDGINGRITSFMAGMVYAEFVSLRIDPVVYFHRLDKEFKKRTLLKKRSRNHNKKR